MGIWDNIWNSGNQEVRQPRESLAVELWMNELLFHFALPHGFIPFLIS
jgi:hypothetical protein